MKRLRILIILSAFPSFAYAHGQEVIVPLLGQVVIVILCLSIFAVRRFSLLSRIFAFCGCILGVAIAWFATADLPFNYNRTYIGVLDIGLPVLGFISALLVAIMFARNPSSLSREIAQKRVIPASVLESERHSFLKQLHPFLLISFVSVLWFVGSTMLIIILAALNVPGINEYGYEILIPFTIWLISIVGGLIHALVLLRKRCNVSSPTS